MFKRVSNYLTRSPTPKVKTLQTFLIKKKIFSQHKEKHVSNPSEWEGRIQRLLSLSIMNKHHVQDFFPQVDEMFSPVSKHEIPHPNRHGCHMDHSSFLKTCNLQLEFWKHYL